MAGANQIVPYQPRTYYGLDPDTFANRLGKVVVESERLGLRARREVVIGALFLNAVGYLCCDHETRPMKWVQLLTVGIFLCIFALNAKSTGQEYATKRKALKAEIQKREAGENALLEKLEGYSKRTDLPMTDRYAKLVELKRTRVDLHILMDPAYDHNGSCSLDVNYPLTFINSTRYTVISSLIDLDRLSRAYPEKSFEYLRFDMHATPDILRLGRECLTARRINPVTWKTLGRLARKAIVLEACAAGGRGGLADAIAAVGLDVPLIASETPICHLTPKLRYSEEERKEWMREIRQAFIPVITPGKSGEGMTDLDLFKAVYQHSGTYEFSELFKLAVEERYPEEPEDISFIPSADVSYPKVRHSEWPRRILGPR